MSRKIQKVIGYSNEKILIGAIDIGSVSHMGYWRCNNKEIKPFKFSNNEKGFKQFWKEIMIGKRTQKATRVIIGLESTGSYGEPLLHYLDGKESIELVQINPMHTKRVKELLGNSPNKTDKKDPKVIADIISLNRYLSVIVPKGASSELRQLSHARERILKKKTSASNQIEGLLAKIFPEFMPIMKKVTNKSTMYLLQHYPTPSGLTKSFSREELSTLLRRISRGRLGRKRALELYNAAQHSVGIKKDIKGTLLELQYLLEEIHTHTRHIEELEKQMDGCLRKIPYSSNLLSIPRVGTITVAMVIGEVGDFTKITHSHALIKLAGLNLYEVSSGKHKGTIRITKRGRALLRKMLYFASLNVVRKGGILHEYYRNLISSGKKRNKALIMVSKKILRIMFALVKNGSCYDPDYSLKKAA
jgi:transposase